MATPRTDQTTTLPPALALALLAVATLVAYWPTYTAAFIWDDDVMVTSNGLVKAADGLYRMWFTTQPVDYWPMTGTSLWIEWRLWGLHAGGYHATNVLLHLGSAIVLWRILARLAIPGAWLAAAFFALHPVNVESVAWIAQRKNTLSLIFFLLSLLWYLRSEEVSDARAVPPAAKRSKAKHAGSPSPELPRQDSGSRWYWLSLAAFALAMLSKGSVAMLPPILLLLAWWQRGTISRRDLVRTLPFFVVAVGLTLVNLWFQARGGADAVRDVTLVQRVLGAGAVVWFYLYKALLPVRLVFIYPQWNIVAASVLWWLPLIAAVLVTAALLWQRNHPIGRALLFAWCFFGLALVPVMGLTDVYFMRYSLVADHYQYVALVAVVAGVAAVLYRFTPKPEIAGSAIAVILAALTWQQSHLYANSTTLYERTLEANPGAWLAHNNLALMYLAASPPAVDRAYSHLQAGLATNPNESALHNNFGTTLFRMGRFEDAATHHREAVRLSPTYANAYGNLGADLQKLGRYAEAVDAYREAIRLDPAMSYVRADLAKALDASGRTGEAATELQQAATSGAGGAQGRAASGDALLQLGRHDEAIAQYREALRLDPNSARTLSNLGVALLATGRLDEAERALRQAIRLRPDDAAAHDNLGNVLQRTGRLEEAVAEFKVALARGSGMDLAAMHNDMGTALARLGRLDEATTHFEEAVRINPGLTAAHANLARAKAAKGR